MRHSVHTEAPNRLQLSDFTALESDRYPLKPERGLLRDDAIDAQGDNGADAGGPFLQIRGPLLHVELSIVTNMWSCQRICLCMRSCECEEISTDMVTRVLTCDVLLKCASITIETALVSAALVVWATAHHENVVRFTV